jgi:hypothetical protein
MATRRPDLEAAPYKEPNYIWKAIMPLYEVMVKTGDTRFQDIVADAAAQTDRTLGTAPTATRIDSAKVTFSLNEKIKRYKMDNSEIEQLGGLLMAQMKGARAGKRAVGAAIETAAIASTFGDEANINSADILTSFLKTLDVAKETVMDYADGPLGLFGAYKVANRLKRYDEVVERMTFTGVLPGNVRDVRSISDAQLAAAIGVDQVLPGPSAASAAGWLGAASAYDGWLGLMALPDASADPDEEIQFGRMFAMNSGSAGELFQVETYYSDDLRSEVVDTTAWIDEQVFNKEACYILKGIDEENTVTTTAS